MRDFLKKLKNHNISFLMVIFFIGIFSYVGDVLLFQSKLNSNIFINGLAVVSMYLYNKKTGSIVYFLGACTAFIVVRTYKFAPFSDLSVLIFSSLYLAFFSRVFRNMIDKWTFKKTINYFIYSTVLICFSYMLYILLLLYVYVLLNSNNPFLKNKNIFFIMKNIIKYQFGSNPILYISNISFSSMVSNITVFSLSYWASIFLFFINLKNNIGGAVSNKFEIFNIPVPKNYKYIFAGVVSATIVSMYFSLLLFYLLLSLCISLLFLFFIVGREIVLNILYEISPNIIMVNIILMILQSFVPMFVFVLIAIGIVEVYCKLWNENREQ